ncbi:MULTISPECIES: ubiquinol-cytochrome c reductase iron-sulfur subunit [Marinobacter]|mgnify:FL=1|jgi:ubiquinol-cytochrome c reductase iron-sulfur subunit|uniref:Ubiquinol-cytochrome c reductase iron-sulfur subunit n=2 Tax=Marinobacter TaxID=2742 RepID=A0A3D8GZ41_9GAMM|nr:MULTISPECIES: ubiquinol-cytochrome c reductase iron-sulfur subunit [Marinobacter]MCP4063370.1 ubiquinol-cytochrome c reductase iron-sulfur subunit [Gammaproteobacteria bacterium]EHJ03213.1 ubiquinol-cytochrome c reductase, iron-sulfur subunit [Marinobacter manganoxydans MnI7-9]MAK51270.1 ubiquinol-cytochrome c reductase iron-sulfur subunit [Marinobacter sp.]MBQ92820.1 ubiquinol-cytochrome c reductase iron-sulfur subunit [Marinobacter sp.]MCW8977781.1 ubiquinol-cytochrome c reductase iron-su|tara:strand:- start:347 stop:940 length:594 start_codon:yes stop_codon:yes gene_type:complete|mmetsp:Transcript_19006/g.28644  ORF Transcript_19006/g.28644 Transcript_19006/m.28644 type:complete len:198 (+) Transcript_19006:72-665(+)
MNNGDVSQGRRRFLIGATSVVGGVGVVGAAVPFLGSWNPSAKAEAAGAPVTVNISKIEPGQQITVEWRGQPVWIIRRTDEMNENIEKLNDRVKDPNSEVPQQPEYIDGILRSLKPEFAVLVGLCTHLGCVPSYRPEVAPADLGDEWLGGLFCPCHGSRYDMAGRVYEAQPAPTNLVVPPYRFDDDSTLTIGLDPEAA